MDEHLYTAFAAAFVRGRAAQADPIDLPYRYREATLDDLSQGQLQEIIQAGHAAGLRLHKFKRTMGLARVRRVLGALRGLVPADLLDVGSGRGTSLWPLLDEFPELRVTAIDSMPQRANDLTAVSLGGIDQLTAHEMDVTNMSFDDDHSFDVVTMLEVLEHIPDTAAALREVGRVARRFVVLSVPSKDDDNPDHIHVFSEGQLREAFLLAGVDRITFDYIRGHIVAVANVEP